MGDAKLPFDDEVPTKLHSGSLQRGPIWEGLARILAEQMLEAERRDQAELDRMPEAHSPFGEATRSLIGTRLHARMLEARTIAEEARHLAREIKAWETRDPGTEARAATLSSWRALERRARDFEARRGKDDSLTL